MIAVIALSRRLASCHQITGAAAVTFNAPTETGQRERATAGRRASYSGCVLYQQYRPALWHRHPFIAGVALIAAVWMVQAGWYTPVVLAAGIVVFIALRRRQRDGVARRAGLAARADLENRMVLAGDPRGVHGRYPPVRAGWFHDPGHPARLRYFDGAVWTRYTADR